MRTSETITNIAKALSEFQGEVSKISKDGENPFYKNSYATLDNIIGEVRPLLAKNGLSLLQIPTGDGESVGVKTILLHTSGEFLEGDELNMKPVKNDPQGIGSTITYARRYSLSAFLNLNTGEDDDGNEGSNKSKLTDNQVNALLSLAKKKGQSKSLVIKAVNRQYGISDLSLLTSDQYKTVVKGYEKLEEK